MMAIIREFIWGGEGHAWGVEPGKEEKKGIEEEHASSDKCSRVHLSIFLLHAGRTLPGQLAFCDA
jgi:hypothetical protein